MSNATLAAGASDSYLTLGYDNHGNTDRVGERQLDKNRALERFLSDVEKRAFRIAQIATSNSDEAFDIVQDAMFKLVDKYAGKDESEWQALFHSILQSRIRDWYRRNKVRNRFRSWLGGNAQDEEDPFQSVEDTAGRSPEQQLQTGRSIEALEAALQALPPRQQQAFMLRAWEGLDVRQTARAMSCAEGSVKTHYSRAVHSLRETLGEHWQD